MTKYLTTLLLTITLGYAKAQWMSTSTGLPEKSTPMGLAVKSSTLFAVFGEGMFISTDQGKSWQRKVMTTDTQAQPDLQKISVAGDSLFAGGVDFLYISEDRGASWKKYSTAPKSMYYNKVLSSGPDLYLGTVDGLFYSANKGLKWKEITSKIKRESITDTDGEKLEIRNIDCAVKIDKTLYVGASSGIYATVDNGKEWKPLNEGLPKKRDVTLLEMAGDIFYTSLDDGLYVSRDRGLLWKKVENGLPKNTRVTSLISTTTAMFVSVFQKGIFMSKDHGETWTEFNTGLPKDANSWSLLVDNNRLYATIVEQGYGPTTV